MNDLCVLGLGYIGLPTASIFATKGLRVLGVDVVPDVVETINRGEIHIEEPDLDIMVRAAVQSGNLTVATTPSAASTFIIAVPTPFKRIGDHQKRPDLTYVESATRSIAPYVKAGNLIVVESTSPVGTTEKVRDWLEEALAEREDAPEVSQLHFAHCPERVLPGHMLAELVSNDRLAGGLTEKAGEKAQEFYAKICQGEIHLTDARTAELVKLTENASRDVGIAFANEMSMICEHLRLNVWEVIALANKHPRVNILKPGPGVGGHCIAVDPWFIVDSAPEDSQLIRMARQVNDEKPQRVLAQVVRKAKRFKRPVIACFGLAFKADIDDIRESPALSITEALSDADDSFEVLVVEPNLGTLPPSLDGKARFVKISEALDRADIVVLLVDHREFATIDRSHLHDKVVIDTRGTWS